MNLANKLTIFRVLLIPVFVFFLITPIFDPWGSWIALGVFCAASFTDFLDGFIARHYNMVTNFGKFMDPLADKLLVCIAMICLLVIGRLDLVFVLVVIAREFIISGFRLVAADNNIVIAASWWGKLKTVSHMFLIIVLLLNIENEVFEIIQLILYFAAWALTLISLFDYIYKNRAVLKENK